MRRIISIWLPHWPVERWRRTNPGQGSESLPFALTETLDQTQKLYAVCPKAAEKGLRSDMTLAEARAMFPHLQTAPAKRDEDAIALKKLAYWMGRYSPLVAVDGPDGLLLDSTGCDHLFGGEEALLRDIEIRLAGAGFTAQTAMAETRGAAWALARYGKPRTIQSGPVDAYLFPLKIHALRIDFPTIVTLTRLGLKRIGDLAGIPRASLARRFQGKPSKQVASLLARLDEVFGRIEQPIEPLGPIACWQTRRAFMTPVLDLAQLEMALAELIYDLTEALKESMVGALRLALQAFRIDGSAQTIRIGTSSASNDPEHLKSLFREKLDAFDAGFGFDLLLLMATETEALCPAQLGSGEPDHEQDAQRFYDRITNRLGQGAICRLKHTESHLPERAQTLSPVSEVDLNWQTFPTFKAPRPIRLLTRPEAIDVMAEVPEGAPRQFKWRRLHHRVVKAEGPERLSSEWWIDPNQQTRDYYRVEVEEGARFWIFRYGLYGVGGVRAAECVAPRWYLHGFFA